MDEAIKILDEWLTITSQRVMISADEVQNVLLDVRQALVRPPVVEEVVEKEPEAVPT